VSDKKKGGNSPKFTRQIFLWLAQVNCDRELPVSAIGFAVALAPYFNEAEGGMAWPSFDVLAAAAGTSKSVAQAMAIALEKRGHVRIEWGKRGRGSSNHYWMILKVRQDELSEAEKSSAERTFRARKSSDSPPGKVRIWPNKSSSGRTDSSKDSSKDSSSSAGRDEDSGKAGKTRTGSSASVNGAAGRVGENRHPYAKLLAKLLQAADNNVALDDWGVAVHGIDVVEAIQDLINYKGCDLDQDILPAITEVVPTLAEPLASWDDPRVRDACLARKRTREAEARAKEKAP
jgi:hypothetical protein